MKEKLKQKDNKIKTQRIQKYEKQTKFFRHRKIFQVEKYERDNKCIGHPYDWRTEIILD